MPANPDEPQEWLADFWVEYGGNEYLIDVSAEDKADTAPSGTPWELLADGYETVETGRGRVTPRWLWARRSLLLGLEQAHPYAVSARQQGGLKLTCHKLLTEWPSAGLTIGDAGESLGDNRFVLQSAIFHLIRIGQLDLEWAQGLSLNTRLRKVDHAPQS
ncbi:hypothetical protein FQY83_03035 [Luteimonas marina]|uniref:Uncharacterized protein n=1 Tax=Luteimonas marina TaxID=488485 RepID=A0A5C5UCK2_9GAMM|nr:hypothetical protein [Luteimonas marina]TWT23618.1 hypothetical protein FQY83_03035 [Luteimonas marina]